MSEGPLFILAGNGAYPNRGCEAVVRGTAKTIRRQYPDARFLCISHFKYKEEFEQQRRNEADEGIEHLACFHPSRKEAIASFYRPSTWKYVYRSLYNEERLGRSVYKRMIPHLKDAKAVLSIAADNYSLYHGTARMFVTLDDLVLSKDRPLVLWGASVGPFHIEPEYEAFMSEHLKKAKVIFARETATMRYLGRIGVTANVRRTADPSFLLDPVKPEGILDEYPIYDDAIGLNFSPRLAGHVTGGDMDKWTKMVASIIDEVSVSTGMPIFLIPHATRACSDDHAFMKSALALAKQTEKVVLLPPTYNAAETKWIIGQMEMFAGARTHSVIDALSCCVPTLSIGYGMKTIGINYDTFGSTRFYIDPNHLSPQAVSMRLVEMLDERPAIREHLSKRSKAFTNMAFISGAKLKEALDG